MDAEHLDFEDKYFDIVVSFGLFEHIQPIEKLCKAISEVERVAKSYVICVPSIATVFEPHVMSFYWQLRSPKKKAPHNALNYCSDDAWLQFNGFSGAKITRFWYIPLLIQDTFIYKLAAAA
jgi:ubiquinone/menaquinone biosynthesis C-methylase UbiE